MNKGVFCVCSCASRGTLGRMPIPKVMYPARDDPSDIPSTAVVPFGGQARCKGPYRCGALWNNREFLPWICDIYFLILFSLLSELFPLAQISYLTSQGSLGTIDNTTCDHRSSKWLLLNLRKSSTTLVQIQITMTAMPSTRLVETSKQIRQRRREHFEKSTTELFPFCSQHTCSTRTPSIWRVSMGCSKERI